MPFLEKVDSLRKARIDFGLTNSLGHLRLRIFRVVFKMQAGDFAVHFLGRIGLLENGQSFSPRDRGRSVIRLAVSIKSFQSVSLLNQEVAVFFQGVMDIALEQAQFLLGVHLIRLFADDAQHQIVGGEQMALLPFHFGFFQPPAPAFLMVPLFRMRHVGDRVFNEIGV